MVTRTQLKAAKAELAKQYKCKPSEIRVDTMNDELEMCIVRAEPEGFENWDYARQVEWSNERESEPIAAIEIGNDSECCGLLEIYELSGIKSRAIATIFLDYLQDNYREALVYATTIQSQKVQRQALEEAGFVAAARGKSKKTNNTITILAAPLHKAA